MIVEHLAWQWLFWLPLVVIAVAAFCTWRFVPESPVRIPGRPSWLAAILMSVGISTLLIAVSQTTAWGLGLVSDVRTVRRRRTGLLCVGHGRVDEFLSST